MSVQRIAFSVQSVRCTLYALVWGQSNESVELAALARQTYGGLA